jgi:N-acetylmuramoyl-L-alanine amidase
MRDSERRARGAWLLVWLLSLPVLLGVQRPSGLGDVTEVRTWSYEKYTRVVVELSRGVDVSETDLVRLAADPRAGRPERLYLDVPGIWVGRRYEAGIDVGDGLLEAVRLGQNTLRRTRLVIDLERYARHRIFTLPSPPRIVVDVYGDRPSEPADGGTRLPAELRRVHTVVVDPGHGGRDPGAIGHGGLKEKDVNLAIAQLLAKELRSRDFKVVLTRDEDRTLSLEERTARAESAGGDVFISIHANASRRSGARGIEVYTLDANHERHSLDVAARENGVPAARLDPLQRALARIQVGEVGAHSARLASLIHERVIRAARSEDQALPDLGVKKGPFYVLFMSSMSSVLVETGFVTNRSDAGLLRSDPYRAMLAEQIAVGVERYRQEMELGLAAMEGVPR